MLHNSDPYSDYAFRFTPAAVAKTATFYAGRAFLVPCLGFALPLVALLFPSRRTWLGLTMLIALFVPLLFLPGRIYAAYCYAPFLGLAVTLSGVAESARPAAIVAFFLLCAPLQLHELRVQRRAKLALDDQVREWVTEVANYARNAPKPLAVVYSGAIPGFGTWGMEGAVHYVYDDLKLPFRSVDNGGTALIQDEHAPLLEWKPNARKLKIVEARTFSIHTPFVHIDGTEPPGDLLEGWYTLEDNFRWIAPHAAIRLRRPDGPVTFSLRATVTAEMLRAVGPITVRVALDGHELSPRQWDRAGWQTEQWPLPPAPAGFVLVTIEARPPFRPAHDTRMLGLAVSALGFEP